MEENNNQGCGGGGGDGGGERSSGGGGGGGSETVRSRWTPKPEQILILESIFNSGMVNPPKEETVRIRKLLEKFGAVGDANVFYWFQNRRSRSRRRQRQLQASLAASASLAAGDTQANMGYHNYQQQQPTGSSSAAIQYEGGSYGCGSMGFMGGAMSTTSKPSSPPPPSYSYYVGGQSSEESMFSMSSNPLVLSGGGSFQEAVVVPSSSPSDIIMSSSSAAAPEASNFLYQTSAGGGGGVVVGTEGYITVFINGMATQVPRGPLDVRSMFGEVDGLLHSSGLSLPVNEYGFLLPGLHPGESYFLVSRQP